MALRWGSRARKLALLGAIAALAPVVAVAPASPASAAPNAMFVSEAAPWSSTNSSFAADWFELTNGTAAAVNVTGWKMDDSAPSFATAVPMSGITSIAPGESVIYIEAPAAATAPQIAAIIAGFKTTWFGSSVPSGLQVGTYGGNGVGLSTGGDAVNVYDGAGVLQAGITFGASANSTSVPLQTFDNAAGLSGAVTLLSVAGTNLAFAAPTPAPALSQTGSPGTATVVAPSGPTTTTVATTTTVPSGPAYDVWPGGSGVATGDLTATFTSNLSGLDYEGTGNAAVPGTIWGVVNGPGTLYRLVFNGTNWVPDTAGSWGSGKPLRYPTGLGDPDAEGVTMVGDTSAGGLYVATERDNSVGASRLSVLRFDPSAAGATLTATNEWNLTVDLPVVVPNGGFEGITWIDDSFLTGGGFFDDAKGHAYNPADYPLHGTGLFLVGVEGTGSVHVYALNSDNTFARVTTFASGFTPTTVMELQFDRDLHDLWAVCDDTCSGRTHVLRIDGTGHFAVALRYERPASMPNTNNEGFAIAPATYCSSGVKPVYWSDDNDFGGFSLRSGTLPCTPLSVVPPAQVPEFPLAALALMGSLGLFGLWIASVRRSVRLHPAV